MASLGRFLPNLFSLTQRVITQNVTNFHSITNGTARTAQCLVPGGGFTLSIRNKVRCYFPRPSERKRIKRHGWWKRMSTLAGRRILMRGILKGKHVLSH